MKAGNILINFAESESVRLNLKVDLQGLAQEITEKFNRILKKYKLQSDNAVDHVFIIPVTKLVDFIKDFKNLAETEDVNFSIEENIFLQELKKIT